MNSPFSQRGRADCVKKGRGKASTITQQATLSLNAKSVGERALRLVFKKGLRRRHHAAARAKMAWSWFQSFLCPPLISPSQSSASLLVSSTRTMVGAKKGQHSPVECCRRELRKTAAPLRTRTLLSSRSRVAAVPSSALRPLASPQLIDRQSCSGSRSYLPPLSAT